MQQGPLAPRALPRFPATTGLAATVSPSIAFPVCRLYDLPCSIDFPMGRGRFLQLLDMSLPPCCPLPPRRSDMAPRSVCALSSCLRPTKGGSAFGSLIYRGHLWVHSRYGPVTRSPSQGWLCQLASSASFPLRIQPKLRGPDFSPGGTVSHRTCQPFTGRTLVKLFMRPGRGI
jgi:hypothetical protein